MYLKKNCIVILSQIYKNNYNLLNKVISMLNLIINVALQYKMAVNQKL